MMILHLPPSANTFALSIKSPTFALESSWGIRAEGMTTLSSNLDASPKKSLPKRLFIFCLVR